MLKKTKTCKRWYHGTVVKVSKKERKILINFDGWDEEWDEVFEIESNRLARLNSVITDPSPYFDTRVAEQKEKSFPYTVKQFSTRNVSMVSYEKSNSVQNNEINSDMNITDNKSESLKIVAPIHNEKNDKKNNDSNAIDEKIDDIFDTSNLENDKLFSEMTINKQSQNLKSKTRQYPMTQVRAI